MDTMIELPAMRRSAELAPNTADADSRTVEVVWSAGARVRRAALFGEPHDEELSMVPEHVRLERLNAGAPFLKVHELDTLDAVIGSVVPGSARIENGRGIARIRLSERDSVGDIWRDIEAGHIRAVSIGYQVHRFEISKPDGQRELWRAVDWTPFEISAVPVGADPAAGFRSNSEHETCVLHRRDAPTEQGASPMTDKTESPAVTAEQKSETAVPEETTMTDNKTGAAAETQTRAAETKPNATNPAPDSAREDRARSVDTDALVSEARAQERERVSTIHGLADKLHLERGFADDLIKRGVSIDEARRLILDQVAAKADETRTFPHVSIPLGGRDATVTRREAISNALLHRYSPTLFPLEDAAREYRGMTLMELARESLETAGASTRGLSRDEVATRALHSTSDFPEILAAVTNKTLRQAYEAYPKAGESLNAAALVWSKAPVIVGAHDTGPLIRSKNGFWLAIPLPAAGKSLRGGRITPGEWERRRGLRLRFVYRRTGPSLLVAEGRLNTRGQAVVSRSKTGRGKGSSVRNRSSGSIAAKNAPIFLLVPQVKLPKRLDLARDADRAFDGVPGLIVANWIDRRP